MNREISTAGDAMSADMDVAVNQRESGNDSSSTTKLLPGHNAPASAAAQGKGAPLELPSCKRQCTEADKPSNHQAVAAFLGCCSSRVVTPSLHAAAVGGSLPGLVCIAAITHPTDVSEPETVHTPQQQQATAAFCLGGAAVLQQPANATRARLNKRPRSHSVLHDDADDDNDADDQGEGEDDGGDDEDDAPADNPLAKQQPSHSADTSNGTSSGTRSGDNQVASDCWVLSRLEVLAEQQQQQQQQQDLIMYSAGSSCMYRFGLQALLGVGGEASAWQVVVTDVQPQPEQTDPSAASAPPSLTACTAGVAAPAGDPTLFEEPVTGSRSCTTIRVGCQYALKIAGSQCDGSHEMKVQRKNLQAEYAAMVAAASKHVVRVFDVGCVVLPAAARVSQDGGGQEENEAAGDGCEVRVPCMLMELSTVGSLQDYVARMNQKLAAEEVDRGGLTQQQAQHVAGHVVRGLCCIHNCEIVHRDLKSDNVLGFAPDGVDPVLEPEKVVWKVTDFGCAFKRKKGFSSFFHYPQTYTGTPGPGMAPEMAAAKDAPGRCNYSWQVDVWALAMLWFNIRFGAPAFGYSDEPEHWSLAELDKPDCPYTDAGAELFIGGPVSELELGFIRCCMSTEPGKRWSVDRLRMHKYLRN